MPDSRDCCTGLILWAAVMLPGCGTVPLPRDTTPPTLSLSTSGANRILRVDQGTTSPVAQRAMSTDTVGFTTSALDNESGVRRLDILGDILVECYPLQGTTKVVIRDPIAHSLPSGGGTASGRASLTYTASIATQRARCPGATRFGKLAITLRAEAENNEGQTVKTESIRVDNYGPDYLVVGTFNLYRPGNHPDSQYQRWGRELGAQAEVLLLTEVADRRRAELLATAAGMPHVVLFAETDSDVAIASTYPIRVLQRDQAAPVGALPSGNSNIVSAEIDIAGYPHRFIATHWGIRDARDANNPQGVPRGPHQPSVSRLEAASKILALLPPPADIVFVGGDLNAYSGIGPQDHDGLGNTTDFVGSTPEVDRLMGVLTDSYVATGMPGFCSNQRIDYIFHRGPYRAIRYQSCWTEASPSDHPFVLVTYEAN